MNPRISLQIIATVIAFALVSLGAAQQSVAISSITTAALDREAIIEGEVAGYSPSSYERQPHRLTIRDDSGIITVVLWADVYDQLLPAPIAGSRVTIRGTVGEYRGEVQLQVSDPNHVITSAGGDAPPAMPTLDSSPTALSQISNGGTGSFVCVVGQIESIRRSNSETSPNVLTIRDNSGRGQVVIWPDDYGHIRPAPSQGTAIRVVGEIRDYRGTTQIYCRDSSLVVVGQAALRASASHSSSSLARSITASGDVAWQSDVAGAQRRARSGGHQMLLYAFTELSNTCQEFEADVLVDPDVIEAIGGTIPLRLNMREHTEDAHRFSVFRVPTLVIYNPSGQELDRLTGDISADDLIEMIEGVASESTTPAPAQVAAPAARPQRPAAPAMNITPIPSVGQSMVGRTVIIEGTVTDVREAWNDRAPNIITLSDGSNSVPVIAWSDKWNSLSRQPQSGDRVRVRGEVSLYERRNEIQIQLDAILFAR